MTDTQSKFGMMALVAGCARGVGANPTRNDFLKHKREATMGDMKEIVITKADLENALRRWEQDARDGKLLPAADNALKTVDEVAKANADYMWRALTIVKAEDDTQDLDEKAGEA